MIAEKTGSQALNAILTVLTYIESTVIWITSTDYEQQPFYLNNAYENIWGHSCESLFRQPKSWLNALIDEDLSFVLPELTKRSQTANYSSCLPMRVHRPDGQLRWLKSITHTLSNSLGKPVLMIRTDEMITSEQWEALPKEPTPVCRENLLAKDFISVIEKEMHVFLNNNSSKNLVIDGNLISITKREAECLQYLINGCSAKQTAHKMCLSTRTVEAYLDNIRKKTKCRTKIALIGKIQNHHQFSSTALQETR